jgi:hypothetical protein
VRPRGVVLVPVAPPPPAARRERPAADRAVFFVLRPVFRAADFLPPARAAAVRPAALRALFRAVFFRLPPVFRDPAARELLFRPPPVLFRDPPALRAPLRDPPARLASFASDRSSPTLRPCSSARSSLTPPRRRDSVICSSRRARLLSDLPPRGGIRLLPRATVARSCAMIAISKPQKLPTSNFQLPNSLAADSFLGVGTWELGVPLDRPIRVG